MGLGDILVRQGKVTPSQIAEALEKQSLADDPVRLGEWLAGQGIVHSEDVLAALAEQFGLPFMPTVDDHLLDPTLVEHLPVEWARSHHMLPVRFNGDVAVLTADPTKVSEQDDLTLLLGCEFNLIVAPPEIIRRSIERCYYSRQDTTEEFLDDLSRERPVQPAADIARSDDLLRVADQAPVTQLVNLILLEALKADASDIHIEPYADKMRMRYRIDGILYDKAAPPKHMESALISRLKVMAHLDIAEKRLPQDGAARVRVGEREIDIRVSTVPVSDGERVVLRLLHRESALLSLEQLGMDDRMRARFQDLLREPYGVIWVTGPTGSGKTTTLYAALQELDTRSLNVITIEDPVEYQLPTISQMAVKPKIGLTFARGLRHILRQDPDVILVGETRDMETAEIVVRASLTGHLVFSTLHTNDAAGAVVRLVDMGVEPYLVASSTRAALAQRLVRRLCPSCREAGGLSDAEKALLGSRAGRLDGKTTYRARGCSACTGGYRGRVGLFELIVLEPDIQEAVRTGAGSRALQAMAGQHGMKSLLDDGLDKVLAGVTSAEELIRVTGHVV